eukprot:767983-Hanusia_phi.AAC.3
MEGSDSWGIHCLSSGRVVCRGDAGVSVAERGGGLMLGVASGVGERGVRMGGKCWEGDEPEDKYVQRSYP